MKTFWFIILHTKHWLVQSHCLLGWINKTDGFIRVYDETGYLVLFGPEKYGDVYNKIRYTISQKMGLHMLFLVIKQESKIYMILYP